MVKLKLEDKDYDIEDLSVQGLKILELLKVADQRMKENVNTLALLTRAKRSYISDIKKEILSSKAGVTIGD